MVISVKLSANKKAALVLILIGLMVLCIISIRPVKAARKIVVPDDYPTIQAAIDNAFEGDEVFVKSGIYSENLLINKSLSLVGENKYSTVVVGDGTTALLVQHDNVNVRGFTFKRPSTMRWYYGVHLLNVKHCNVFGNIVESTFYGVWLFGASFNNVFENTLTGNLVGIHLENSHRNNIFKNNVTGNDLGISTLDSNSNILIDNYVAANGAGIGVYGVSSSRDNVVAGNVVSKNGNIGIEISSSFNQLVGNYIAANGLAISLGGGGSNLVVGNRILENQEGIYIEASQSNTVRWNLIESNTGGAINIHSFPDKDAINNVIYENNIIDNSVTFTYPLYKGSEANIWDFDSRGNYWSAYKGTDRNGDGIGDSPYILNGDNVDHYPFMAPFDISSITARLLELVRMSLSFSSFLELFPTIIVATVVSVAYVVAGLLIYFRKRNH
jgi:parallel beta-helix repeat protein